jgi:hypothetical protein
MLIVFESVGLPCASVEQLTGTAPSSEHPAPLSTGLGFALF